MSLDLSAAKFDTTLTHANRDFCRVPVNSHGAHVLQAKLLVNTPGDEYEREADDVSDSILQMSGSALQRTCTCDGECPKCRKPFDVGDAEHLQAKHSPTVGRGSLVAPPLVDEAIRETGQPLAPSTRKYFEPRFGSDFSQVRVHTGALAAQSAQDVQARAYTVGQHIVFGAGEYTPGTNAGNRLLAHELVHTIQQGNATVRRQEATCLKTFRRTTNVADYISLVREAEVRLAAAGYSSVEDRIHVLRGIYYGTIWSADYGVEHSDVRNTGFQVYTASTTPADPRSILSCGLFEALRDSRDVLSGGRRVDVGHLMIGLDARRSWNARNVPIPTQGGTGLDISTWLGDLGGGAAMLAYRRVGTPSTSVMSVYHGSDFGGSFNLEGDIAAFAVARGRHATLSEPPPLDFSGTTTIADALADYLLPKTASVGRTEWDNRCRTFMQIKGATFSATGVLTNRVALIRSLKSQIEQFACWYLVNRLRQSGRLNLSTLRSASLHISGASEEVATVFVDALDSCQATSGRSISPTTSVPAASAAGTGTPTACTATIRALEAAAWSEQLIDRGSAILRDLGRRTSSP